MRRAAADDAVQIHEHGEAGALVAELRSSQGQDGAFDQFVIRHVTGHDLSVFIKKIIGRYCLSRTAGANGGAHGALRGGHVDDDGLISRRHSPGDGVCAQSNPVSSEWLHPGAGGACGAAGQAPFNERLYIHACRPEVIGVVHIDFSDAVFFRQIAREAGRIHRRRRADAGSRVHGGDGPVFISLDARRGFRVDGVFSDALDEFAQARPARHAVARYSAHIRRREDLRRHFGALLAGSEGHDDFRGETNERFFGNSLLLGHVDGFL